VFSFPDTVVKSPPPDGRIFHGKAGLGCGVKTSMAKAILTDSQFWVPIVVLVIGILLLVYVR
jgi:hypothetical protein